MAMGFQDNPKNILGVNSADNQFDSSDVAANADGSMIERIEYVQTIVDAFTPGDKIIKGTVDTSASSTTVIPIAGLAGYGDDFFNNQFYLQVLHNANSAGNAPEGETRKITDYASTGGSFTCDAFSAAVEEDDICLILHESQVAIGSNNADNVFDSSSVTANATGSVLERLKDLYDRINTVDDFLDTEIAAIKLVTDAIPDAGALTTISGKIDTIDNFLDGANLEKLSGTADGGTHNYPDSVVQDSMLAYLLSKSDPAVTTSYNNTTDSLEAISDKITSANSSIDTINTNVDTINTTVSTINSTVATINSASITIQSATDTIGAVSATTTDCLQGKIGTDDEMLDRSLYDLLNGDGHTAAATAAAPGNNVSLYAAIRAIYNLSVPAATTAAETVIDEGDYDWTSDYPALLTIAPAAGAALTDVVVCLDMDKAVSGFATVYAAQTISLYVERKIDGTNWRREEVIETALAGNSADNRMIEINIGDVGITEQARITADLSAEVSGVAETDLPYVVYYKGLAAPTVTPLTATA
ncbi:MAG: hypothetical protein M0R06_24295 [Sphaerochaeta sp.]|jgi:hypothetical protein|nr:hypothetical protein [Sphaerochaeta sp.]